MYQNQDYYVKKYINHKLLIINYYHCYYYIIINVINYFKQ